MEASSVREAFSKCEPCIPPALQELAGLQEAKQLLIQQKLEVQGQLEAERVLMQTEQQAHQTTRDLVAQREEQLLSQATELQAQLVSTHMHRKQTFNITG